MSAFWQTAIVVLIGLWAATTAARRLLPGPWARAWAALGKRLDGPRRPRWMQRLAAKLRTAPAASGCSSSASACSSCAGCGAARPAPRHIEKPSG